MTDDYAALLALAEAATPGPWDYKNHGEEDRYDVIATASGLLADGLWRVGRSLLWADAAYIAAASPDVVARLIADLTEAVAEVEHLRHPSQGDEVTLRHRPDTMTEVAQTAAARADAAEEKVRHHNREFIKVAEELGAEHALRVAAEAERDGLSRHLEDSQAEVARLTALVHAKESWIEGAKVDLDGYDDARRLLAERDAALDRVRVLPRQDHFAEHGRWVGECVDYDDMIRAIAGEES